MGNKTTYSPDHLVGRVLIPQLKQLGVTSAKKFSKKNQLSETQQEELFREDTKIPRVIISRPDINLDAIASCFSKKNRRKVLANKINNQKNKNGKKERIRNPWRYAKVFLLPENPSLLDT